MTSRWQLSPSGKMISVLKSLFSVGHLSAAVIDQTCALNCVAPRKSLRFAAIHLLWWAKHPPIGGRLLRCDHVYHGIPTRWSRKEPTDDRQADGLIMADEIKLPRNMTRIEIDRELRHLETIDHGRDIARYQALRQALAEKLTKNAISMHCDRKIKTISRVTNLMRQKMAADAAERLEEQQRIRAGWQCPECYGRAHPSPDVTVPAE
jgi:hypothetical protein